MVRKLLGLPLLLTALILAVGCTRKVDKPSRLNIRFPAADSSLNISHNVSTLSTKWQLSDPTTSGQINCYAVAVEAADFPGEPNRCANLSDQALASPSFIHGGFPAGTVQSLDVPSGNNRRIYLIGFQTDDIAKCVAVKGSSGGLANNHFSAPFILTQTMVDLSPGDVDIYLDVPATLPVAGKLEECLPFAFSRNSAPAPLTVTGISPSVGIPAGGNAVVVSGTGFTAGTTVTIGGNACTSPVVISTAISCTAPAGTLGARDVVVSRGLETESLLASYTYANLPAFTISDVTVSESGGSASFTVNLTAPDLSNVTTFTFTTSNGTASSGSDYTMMSASAGTIGINTTIASISVPIADDGADEPNETFQVTVSGLSANAVLSDGIATATITDNDAAPAVDFASTDVSISEATPTVTLTASLSALSGYNVTVDYAVSGTATGGGVDHNLAAGTITISAGNPTSTVTINLTDDAILENNESIIVTLSNPTNASLGAVLTNTITINDNEVPPVLTITDGPTYNYGTQAVGSVTDKTFTITNTGAFPVTSLNGSGLAAPYNFVGGAYPGGGSCTGSLASLGTCTVVVRFAPVGTGATSDSLSIDYNDGLAPQSVLRALAGTGATPASVSISGASPVDFGPVDVAVIPQTITLTLTNSGGVPATGLGGTGLGAPYTFDGGSFPGTGGDCPLAGSIVPAGTCTIVIRYYPTTFGTHPDTLDKNYNDGAAAQSVSRNITGDGVLSPVVNPAYNVNGNLWLSYVKNDGPSRFQATNTACVGTENGFDACIHVGEMRKVTLTGLNTCAGVTAVDNLAAFDWKCEVVSSQAYLFSVLKPGKGLRDLVSATPTWMSNYVTVSLGGPTIGVSTPSQWWTDTVAALPDNSATPAAVTLNPGTSTIYVLSSSRATHGYFINANRVAIVTKAGALLSWSNLSPLNCKSTTYDDTATLDSRCVIFSNGRHFLWIEAMMDGFGAAYSAEIGVGLANSAFHRIVGTSIIRMSSVKKGLSLLNVKSSTLRAIEVKNAGRPFYLSASTYNLVIGYHLANGLQASSGVLELASGSDYNTFLDGQVTGHFNGKGVFLPNAAHNVFQTLRVSNVQGSGGNGYLIELAGASTIDNKFTSILGNGCTDAAIALTNNSTPGSGNIFSHATLADCTSNAVYTYASDDSGFNQLAMMNTGDAIHIDTGSNGILMSQMASSSVITYQMRIVAAASAILSGAFVVDSAVCNNASNAGQGVSGSCAVANSSSHTLVPGADFSGTFAGPVTSDGVNSSHVAGVFSTPNFNTDLFSFANPFRVLGLANANAFPDVLHKGAASANLQIYDFRVKTGDVAISNVSGDGTSDNGAFTNLSPCPAGVDSDTEYETMFGNQFLRNAMEIMDNIGDNDGLCEDAEACIYSPNFGFYQGSGSYIGNQCTFANGSAGIGVDDVVMFGHTTNGE